MQKVATNDLANGGPLLIAIHGETGSGKTTLAARFVDAAAAESNVVGWLQPSHGARVAGQGADRYEWQPIGGGAAAVAWLERDTASNPPYRADGEAETHMQQWLAATLADATPIDVLVADEIGAMELAGSGHRDRLDALLARSPSAVIVVVNTRHMTAVADMLGQRFDVVVEASRPDALQRLHEVLATRRDFERVGLFGALAGAFEVGAGSVVHGAKVPLGGLGMATTQAALLTRAAQPLAQRSRVAWVAVLSAAIKSLSPAGQRLRPMLAIVVQGWLYSRALSLFGWNLFGVTSGGMLMGLWAGSQGLLTQWLLFGDAFAVALNKLNQEVSALLGWPPPSLLALIAGWLALHGSAVAMGTALAWRRPVKSAPHARLPSWLVMPSALAKRSWRASMRQALREMMRPVFWLPLVLVISALAWAGQSNESLIWVLLRAILIAWVMFMLVQRLDLPALPAKLRRFGMWGPAIAWQRALAGLNPPKSK